MSEWVSRVSLKNRGKCHFRLSRVRGRPQRCLDKTRPRRWAASARRAATWTPLSPTQMHRRSDVTRRKRTESGKNPSSTLLRSATKRLCERLRFITIPKANGAGLWLLSASPFRRSITDFTWRLECFTSKCWALSTQQCIQVNIETVFCYRTGQNRQTPRNVLLNMPGAWLAFAQQFKARKVIELTQQSCDLANY